jgi:hypothetical protein
MKKLLAVAAVAAVSALAVPTMASASSTCWSSARGCVSVSGYDKPSTGTYVSPYYRNYASYRTPSYRTPSYRTPGYGSYGTSYGYPPSYGGDGLSYGSYGSSYGGS